MTNAGTPVLTPRIMERFWAKVNKRDPFSCWPWTASLTKVGYGQIHVGRQAPVMALAHRVSYQYHRGPIPVGLQLDHLCGNRRCVNPNHLEAVTQQENLRRGTHVKLSVDDVNMILSSPLSTHQLGTQLGVHHSTVWRIRARVGWKPIPGHPQYEHGRPTSLEEARGRIADLLPESIGGGADDLDDVLRDCYVAALEGLRHVKHRRPGAGPQLAYIVRRLELFAPEVMHEDTP